MDIIVPSSGKSPFLMIAAMGDGEFEGDVRTGREREGEATKITKHVASAIIYRLIFVLEADPEDIFEFTRVQFSTEQVKVPMDHSSYKMETTGIVTLHQMADFDNND